MPKWTEVKLTEMLCWIHYFTTYINAGISAKKKKLHSLGVMDFTFSPEKRTNGRILFFSGIYKNNACFKTGEQKQLCQIFPNRMLTGLWTWIPSLNLALAECVRESFTFFKVFKLENLASVLKTFTDSAQLMKAKYCSIKLSVMQCAHMLDICTVEKKNRFLLTE